MCEARNFAACVDEICGARREIYSVKYEIKFHSAAHGDKIYGVMTDNKILGTALAGVRNSGLKNARVNLRSRNTYVDLKFKGSANFEPAGDANFKFKNGASPRLICNGNAKSMKSRASANALNSSGANKILAPVWTGRILSSGISAMDLAFDAAAKNFISSGAARILSSSAEAGILASSLANEILNLSAADEILKSNATGKILSLGAESRTDVELKGAGGC
ncbi:hypothetical protein [uncultured Campylobacter sp.]|uniref:hypothetical protein n=1 Tax=uncultured Campylobacter sp. TaxID=218934 RepID=UPI00261772FB|nr:hypothetical protein [uncultured Campylobacter sp.]